MIKSRALTQPKQNEQRIRLHTSYDETTEQWIVRSYVPPVKFTAPDILTALDLFLVELDSDCRVELVIDSAILGSILNWRR